MVELSDSLECQVGEEGKGEEDCGQATANVCDEGQDVGLEAVHDRFPVEILQTNRVSHTRQHTGSTAPGVHHTSHAGTLYNISSAK